MTKPWKFTTVPIAVERPDASVSIVHFVVIGRGPFLPANAEWADYQSGMFMRFATDEAVAEEVARAVPDAVRWQRITSTAAPADRVYRNALKFDMTHDVPKARELHRSYLRAARNAALQELDGQWMRAQGQGKKADADKIEAERQKWRDAPADPRIDAAQTVDELHALRPGQ